ncbi:MAG: pseudouridine synthase [Candidatus Eremiobacterota bacterium]
MKSYLALFKPYGVLSRFTDPSGRETLARLVDVPGVYPVGRLDMDSEGLLLLSDDGAFQSALLRPGSHFKTYQAQVERIPSDYALERLRRGVLLDGVLTMPARARLIEEPPLPPRPVPIRYRKNVPTAWIELELSEGRNRQVRRMTAAVGHPTLRLVRWRIGPVDLTGLSPGQWREFTPEERRWVAAISRGQQIRTSRR